MRKKKKAESPNGEPKNDALIVVERKRSSGPKCTVCSHTEVKAINSYITERKSIRDIAGQFELSKSSVHRHIENCLKLDVIALIEQNKLENAINHYTELFEQLTFAKELQFAAREWLSDPLNKRISFMPRAEELDVIYLDYLNLDFFGRPTRQRKKLQEILDAIQAMATHIKFQSGHGYKISDTRDFAIRTIDAVDKLLDKFARIEGIYKKDQEIEYELTVRAVTRIETIIARQSAKNPEFKPEFYLTKMFEIASQDFGVSTELIAREYSKRQPQQLSGVQ